MWWIICAGRIALPDLMSLGRKIVFSHMMLHMNNLHDLVMIPHSQVTGIGFQATRLTMNPQALVMLDMAYLISLSPIRCIMPQSKVDPRTMPGGTPTLLHAERFGGTSHIAPSIHVVEASSHAPPRPSVSNPIQIPGPR